MINNEKQYNIILLDKPIQQSKFIFDSLKSDETKIKKSSYLKLKHYISNLYIGTR